MKKTPGDIINSYVRTKNYDQMMYGSWDMVCDRWTDRRTDGWIDGQMDRQMGRQTDGQIDGRKKWHIEVGAPPKKSVTLKI